MHETIFDDGRVHAAFTQTGTFVAVPALRRAWRGHSGAWPIPVRVRLF